LAFTLIEVVFSLAICSFIIVSMLGLMTLGLTTMRQSMELNTEASITQQLSGEAESLGYSVITNNASTYRLNFQNNRYFDGSGVELPNTAVPTDFVYKATLTVTNSCELPGMTSASPVATKLIFTISTRRPGSASSFYLWAADNGR
jgi:uncharacterized protein (TIGR02598 family)